MNEHEHTSKSVKATCIGCRDVLCPAPVRSACWPPGVFAGPSHTSVGSFALSIGPRGRGFAPIAGLHPPVFASPRCPVRKPLHLGAHLAYRTDLEVDLLRGAQSLEDSIETLPRPREQVVQLMDGDAVLVVAEFALHEVFTLEQSKKHLVQRQLGRLGPTPYLKYRAYEVMRNMPVLSI
jgi:hypothetical protein